jgi:hypothetical protein
VADTKISDLAALTGANLATTDEFAVVDKSDTTMAASGTDKRMTAAEVGAGLALIAPMAKDYARATRTSGNITINGTSWAKVDTGVDLTLTAAAGDVIEVGICARLAAGTATQHTFFDVATVVGGSPVNYFGTAGGASDEGVIGWRCQGDRDTSFGCPVARTLVSGDISSGSVTLRLRTRQDAAGNRLFVAGATNPFSWFAKNIGPVA